jgi:DNA-binding NarL/FixJ family response regulator
MPDSIKVLIADDHMILTEGLMMILDREGIEVIGRAVSGRQALDLIEANPPDVVILDIRMPDMDGLQALAAIKSTYPEVSVIMLTSYNNPEYITRSISLGAAGYLLKDTDPMCIPQAVRMVAGGEAILDRDILKSVVEDLSDSTQVNRADEELPSLTPQEIRILQLISEGLDNNTIADLLSVSPNTVKSHISNIFPKLGVSDRTQAAIWAIRRGVAAK